MTLNANVFRCVSCGILVSVPQKHRENGCDADLVRAKWNTDRNRFNDESYMYGGRVIGSGETGFIPKQYKGMIVSRSFNLDLGPVRLAPVLTKPEKIKQKPKNAVKLQQTQKIQLHKLKKQLKKKLEVK